jgi:hypothetical protein
MAKALKGSTRVKKDTKIITALFIGSALFGSINWLFFYEQYIDLNYRYNTVFVLLPIVIGNVLLAKKFPAYLGFYTDIKSKIGKSILILLLLLMGTMISYCSLGTIADLIFKLTSYSYTHKQVAERKTYSILKFHKAISSRRNRFNRFSTFIIAYHGKEQSISTDDPRLVREVENLSDQELRLKKLRLITKKSFWNITYVEKILIQNE